VSTSRYDQDEHIPEPLERRGALRFALWGLPAGALSLASAASLIVTVAVLQLRPALRQLFLLPLGVALAVALVASSASWHVVRTGLTRPGRRAPRLWALALAVITSLTLPWLLFDSRRPLAHALAVGGCAAALTLLPRTLRLGPQSPLVPWIAPASLVAALGFTLPAAVGTGELVVQRHRAGLDAHLARLRDAAVTLREVGETDFSRLADEPKLVQAQLARLQTLQVPALNDVAAWQAARGLGREAELLTASQAVVSAAATALARRHRPSLSRLGDVAELRWDPDARAWVADERFPPASRFIAAYHHALSERFLALEPSGPQAETAPRAVGELREFYRAQRGVVAADLARDWNSWSDRWVLLGLTSKLVEPASSSLGEMLRVPFADSDGPGVAPADLGRLLRWPLHRARSLARAESSCRPQSYFERGVPFYRVDCYLYTRTSDGRGATLQAELRLVYRGSGGSLPEWTRPTEVFYLFPLEAGSTLDSYLRQVCTALRNAVEGVTGREGTGGGRGTPWSGFVLRDGEGLIKVYTARAVTTLPDRQAIEVRAELEGA
jgi:hypothetical protein